MSRDLNADERQTFFEYYGEGLACKDCENKDVIVKIWEKYGSDAGQINGDISPKGIIGAVIVCGKCGYSQTVARDRILKAS